MTRFEIQDLASQNQDGVTFRALDKSTNKIVSLRRFFPFGQDEEGGEGLDPQEGKAFSSACQKLSRVEHPALRKTIYGDTDPVDGMPFLVTEWIEGESLADVLGNNTMDPSMIIGLLRQALDVCMTLSKTLDNEAVWIDTKLEGIIVSNAAESPSFSFRICPFKWLGTQAHAKDLTGMISLVEALMGWKTKLVSDQAGLGLGGWIKLLRQNPQMSLAHALDTLPAPNSESVTETTAGISTIPVQQPYILASANPTVFNKKSIIIMALSACFTGALILFLYLQNVRKTDSSTATIPDDDALAEQQPEILETAPTVEPAPPKTGKTIPSTVTSPLKTASWSPLEIPTAAWYDASNTATITSANGFVSQWNDISGNNGHATQSTKDFQPKTGTRTINKLNAIDFDADKLNRAEINMNGKAIFAIVLPDEGGGGQIFSHSNVNNQLRLSGRGQVGYAASPTLYKDFRASTEKLTMNKPGMVGYILNTTLQYSVNGAFDDTGIAETSSVGAAFNQFGARRESEELLDGLIGEIIITESIPDTDTLQRIEGYLAHKWRITENLPADHPYKSSVPAPMGSDVEPLKKPPVMAKTSQPTETVEPKTGSWTPAEISPAAWYDAADASTVITSSGAVSQWNDKSGNGRNISQTTTTQRPSFASKTVSFDGTDDLLFNTDAFMYANKSVDIYVVGAFDSTMADRRLLGESSSSSAKQLYLPFQSMAASATDLTTMGAYIRDDANTIRFQHDTKSLSPTGAFDLSTRKFYQVRDTGNSLTGRVNGGTASTVNYERGNTTLTDFGIGGIPPRPDSTTGSAWMRADVNEIIIVPSLLSDSDRQKIEGYLAHKWSLTTNLPADHPYKLSSPGSSASKTETVKNSPPAQTIPKQQKPPAPEAALWSATEIAPTAWYDASKATIKDGAVSIANAASGGGVISGPASLTSNGIGNLQAVQMNGANQYLTGDYTNTGATLTAFFVGKSSNSNQTPYAGMISTWENGQIFDWDNAGSAVLFSQNNTIENSIYTHRNKVILSTATGTLTTGFLAATAFNGSTNTLYLNGMPSTAVPSLNAFNTSKLILGGRWRNGSIIEPFWNGSIGEVIIFNTDLSTSDRQKIEGYLAHKWSLTVNLPADHPYKDSTPGSSASKTETVKNSPPAQTIPKQQKPPAPKAALWSPTEIAPTAWYDAADTSTITASKGRVSQWNDKSGGAKHLKMAKASNQPTYRNSTLVIELDDRLESDATTMSAFVGPTLNKCAAFAVIKYVSGDVLMQIESDITNRFNLEGNNRFDFPNDTAGKLMGWSKPISNSGFTILAATASGTTQAAHVNGTLVGSKANSLSVTDAKGTRFVLGARDEKRGGESSAIEVQELIFFDAVSEQDRQKTEGYLAHKWNLTGNLPADHPYKSSAPTATPPVLEILIPQNTEYIKTQKEGDPVTLLGTVRSAKLSSTEKSIYLSFSDPVVETEIRVVIHGSEYEGGPFTEEGFAPLIGKNLVFNGIVYTEPFNDRPPFVKITNKTQIRLATSEDKQKSTAALKLAVSTDSKSEAASDIPLFSPDDFDAIAKLELKTPAAVKGVIKSVKIPKPGSGLYFAFSDPWDEKQIQVVAYPKWFEGKIHKDNEFKSIENDLQRLVGKTVLFEGTYVTQVGNNTRHFVYITSRDQIKETK